MRTFAPAVRAPLVVAPAVDALTIVVLVGIASATYGAQLGFYGTDWNGLERAQSASPLGPAGIAQAFGGGVTVSQSVAFLLFCLEYAIFGPDAAGYHGVLDALVAVASVACYFALRRAGAARPLALGSALVLGFSPLASGARFSLETPAYLSLACAFGSLAAALAVRDAPPRRAALFAFLALAAEYAGAFTCDGTIPLFLANAYILSKRGWTSRALGGATVVTALGAAFVEALLGCHAGLPQGNVAAPAFGSLRPSDAVLAVFVGAAAAAAVFRAALRTPLPETGAACRFTGAGICVLALGFVGLVAVRCGASLPGRDDGSVALASGVGFALTLVGVAATGATLLRGTRKRAGVLALAVGVGCGCSSAHVSGVSGDWRAAGRYHVRVIADLVERTAGLPKRAVVLMGGVCPALGAGPVVASASDATATLRAVLARDDVRADVVSPATRTGPRGIRTSPDDATAWYPYGATTLAYDASTRAVETLSSERDAGRFVAAAEQELAEQCAVR